LTFSAKKTFLHLFFDLFYLTAPKESMALPDIEIDELSGGAGGSTTSAANTNIDTGFNLFQIFHHRFVVAVIIDLPVSGDGISEVL
jgi:hypothetical protein